MLDTAIILAGGFGTRLKSVITDVPKPMAPVNDTPFLDYLLYYLKSHGVNNVVFSTGHLAEKVEAFYGKNFQGVNLFYSVETSPLGTGGAIYLGLEKTKADEVLVLNGDSFFDIDLEEFYGLHKKSGAKVSLALRQVEDASRYGTIETDNHNRIISFREKDGEKKKGLINAGVYIINKDTYLKNNQGGNFSIEKDFFEKKLKDLPIYGFEFKGYFIDIGIPEDYRQAQHDFKRFKYK